MEQQDKYSDQHDWDNEIAPITLKMKKGTWEVFKSLTQRNKKLNDAVVELIHKFISENTEVVTEKEYHQWLKDQDYWTEKKKAKESNPKKYMSERRSR